MNATKKKRGVSLSGKTRLTRREAAMLLDAALCGEAEARCGEGATQGQLNALARAIYKLKQALDKAGMYESDGRLIDPWK